MNRRELLRAGSSGFSIAVTSSLAGRAFAQSSNEIAPGRSGLSPEQMRRLVRIPVMRSKPP